MIGPTTPGDEETVSLWSVVGFLAGVAVMLAVAGILLRRFEQGQR